MRDFFGASCIIMVGSLFLYLSLTSELPIFIQTGAPGPMFFPILLSLALILIGSLIIVESVRRGDFKMDFSSLFTLTKDDLKYPLAFLLAGILYIVSFQQIGCILSTSIYLVIFQRILKVRFLISILTTFLAVLIIFILFIKTLRVVFPEPVIGWLIYSLASFPLLSGG